MKGIEKLGHGLIELTVTEAAGCTGGGTRPTLIKPGPPPDDGVYPPVPPVIDWL